MFTLHFVSIFLFAMGVSTYRPVHNKEVLFIKDVAEAILSMNRTTFSITIRKEWYKDEWNVEKEIRLKEPNFDDCRDNFNKYTNMITKQVSDIVYPQPDWTCIRSELIGPGEVHLVGEHYNKTSRIVILFS